MPRRIRAHLALFASLLAVASLASSGCGLLLEVDSSQGASLDAMPPERLDGGGSGPDGANTSDGAIATTDGSVSDAARPFDASASDGGTVPPVRLDGSVRVDGSASGLLGVGAACGADSQCASGYCYDVSLSNPFCFGAICTIPCMESSECIDYASSHGGSATDRSCVRHSVGDDFVCDFSWGTLPGAAIACE